MTFKGLLPLVTICLGLQHVSLTLDGKEVPSGVAVGLGFKAITALHFPNSLINNQAHLVTKFLLIYFPSVTSIVETCVQALAGAFQVDTYGKEWAEVKKYLVDLSKLESTEPGVNGNQ